MATVAIVNFKNPIFGHVTVIGVNICCISSKSDNFSLRYGDLTISKMAAVRHYKNLQLLSHGFIGMPFCFLVQHFVEIGQSVDEL